MANALIHMPEGQSAGESAALSVVAVKSRSEMLFSMSISTTGLSGLDAVMRKQVI